MDELRDRVAAQLVALSGPGGPLDATSFRLPGIDASGSASFSRVQMRQSIIEEYLASEPPNLLHGFAAVITAGPPGAGKSALIDDRFPIGEWRRIDADAVKDLIVTREIAAGTFDRQLAVVLADDHEVLPRELASLVHGESVIIADSIRRRALAEEENVIIEGTLGWAPHGPRLLRELAAAGYEHVDIVDVEVSQAVALERAVERWWSGRQAALGGGDPLGGRFTPPAAIIEKYTDDGQSRCRINALATFGAPDAELFDEIRLTVHGPRGTETFAKSGAIGR